MNKQWLCGMVLFGGLLLFPQCVPGKGAPQKNSETLNPGGSVEMVNEETAWDSLPEIHPAVKQAFEELGIPVVDRPIPMFDFSTTLVNGDTISLTDLTGKVIFLNFWATWCGPCRMEMPSMEALYRRFKYEGFEILAVDVRENQKDVSAFLNELGLSFPAALDTKGDIASIYAIDAFPTTYIIDRNGRIITRLVGAINWETPELIGLFEALLKVPAAE
jgi:thiol-disulfide isomerase/thioredoxin